MNRDLIMNVASDDTAKAAYHIVDALQFHPPQHQIAAIAAVFVLVMDRYGMPVPDMVQAFRNMQNDERSKAHENVRALKMYVEGELK